MLLTGLAPDPRRPDYRLVEVDRGRFASLPAEALVGLGLVVGAEIPAQVFARLQELADLEGAYRAALRALARRAHARFDLRRRLLQKQHPPAAVDGALARLAALGLLDDARFARDYAGAKATRGGGRGPTRRCGRWRRNGPNSLRGCPQRSGNGGSRLSWSGAGFRGPRCAPSSRLFK